MDGFREDVITLFPKPQPSAGRSPDALLQRACHYNHGPRIHDYLGFRRDATADYDYMTLAGGAHDKPRKGRWNISPSPTGAGHDDTVPVHVRRLPVHGLCPSHSSLPLMKLAFGSAAQAGRLGRGNMYLENHDHPRIISRYGGENTAPGGKCLAARICF